MLHTVGVRAVARQILDGCFAAWNDDQTMADTRFLKGVLKQECIALVVFGVKNHLVGLSHCEISPGVGPAGEAVRFSSSFADANSTQNVLPLPGADSTPTLPPMRSAAF